MAAGPAIFLELGTSPSELATWQLLKSPTGAQTAVTAAKLSQELHDVSFAEDNFEVVDVSLFSGIWISVWGVAADTNTFTLELYGWSNGGPGHHLHQVTGIFSAFTSDAADGFHRSSRTHKSIRNAFVAGTQYRGADTLVAVGTTQFVPNNYSSSSVPVSAQTDLEVDFPCVMKIDVWGMGIKYLGVACTATTGTSVGAIFRPGSFQQSDKYGL